MVFSNLISSANRKKWINTLKQFVGNSRLTFCVWVFIYNFECFVQSSFFQIYIDWLIDWLIDWSIDLVWELPEGYPQKMMEKFLPTFFSQFFGADFENLKYTCQICMKHPYFDLEIKWLGLKSAKIQISLIQKPRVPFDRYFDSEQKNISRLFIKINISKVTGV